VTKPIVIGALMISLAVSGCASLGRSSGLSIRIPERPTVRALPKPVGCVLNSGGDEHECVVSLKADWLTLLEHLKALERELEGACIKIGQVTLPPDWRTDAAQREEAQRLVRQECYAK
jgi:hypothetical protein